MTAKKKAAAKTRRLGYKCLCTWYPMGAGKNLWRTVFNIKCPVHGHRAKNWRDKYKVK